MKIPNIKRKLREKEVTQIYANIITLAQKLGKAEWETPLETTNGTLYVRISFSETPTYEIGLTEHDKPTDDENPNT